MAPTNPAITPSQRCQDTTSRRKTTAGMVMMRGGDVERHGGRHLLGRSEANADIESNPYFSKLFTAADQVLFMNAQPRVAQAQ